MAFIIFLNITWFVIASYITSPCSIRKQENAFLFLFVLAFNISVTWIPLDEG
ncbi:hypothetical protein [Gordoniibacillus kamchatkensis]|uniref:hypothetical protein n=1 Tax=Gordoniibacillus kamchatkensis TaxID=1590651 RepID=UPI000AC66111|nr:hypothetical protein [Paenibacillus sp. VKM B-2647]